MSRIRVTLDYDATMFDGMTASQACRLLRQLVRMFPEPDDIPDEFDLFDDEDRSLGYCRITEIKEESDEPACDSCSVELSADPPHAGEHSNLCHQCNEEEFPKDEASPP